jgi:hypothetical protein
MEAAARNGAAVSGPVPRLLHFGTYHKAVTIYQGFTRYLPLEGVPGRNQTSRFAPVTPDNNLLALFD